MIEKFSAFCDRFVRSLLPDTFVLMLLLTIAAFGLSAWQTQTPTPEILRIWNSGFWRHTQLALEIALQIALIETAFESKPFRFAINKLAQIPTTANAALASVALIAILLGWVHWGTSLIFCALLGREISKKLYFNKITFHYPLMGIAVYSSMLPAHVMSTPGLAITGALAILVPTLVTQFGPRRQPRTLEQFKVDTRATIMREYTQEKPKTFAEKIEQSYTTNLCVGLMAIFFLYQSSFSEDFKLGDTLNLNFLILAIALFLHRNPMSFFTAFSRAARGFASLALQMLFYGGILALLQNTGLIDKVAHFFLNNANKDRLPFNAYLFELINKVFYPIGHAKTVSINWTDRARELGASTDLTTLATVYADHFGNMLHPFWSIPIARIMGFKCRDIMGYGLVIFFFVFPILAVALWNP